MKNIQVKTSCDYQGTCSVGEKKYLKIYLKIKE